MEKRDIKLDCGILEATPAEETDREIIESEENNTDLAREITQIETRFKFNFSAAQSSSSDLNSRAAEFQFPQSSMQFSPSSNTSSGSQNHTLPKITLPRFCR